MKLVYAKICLILLLQSCQSQPKSIENKLPMNQPQREVSKIYQDITKGDTTAYLELRRVYLDSFEGDFLYWALYMSNKHHYPPAYLDVFYSIVHSYVGDIQKFKQMDDATKALALKYLKLARENKVQGAQEIYDTVVHGNAL